MGNTRLSSTMKEALGRMKAPVRLVIFTTETGCEQCPGILELSRTIKAESPRLALETYDAAMDRDKVEQYGIRHVPSVVVQGLDNRSVTFCGTIAGTTLELLIIAITGASAPRAWFPDNVGNTLKALERDVHIQVFVDLDSPLCKPVAETAIGLGFGSNFIYTNIIVAADFPALRTKYRITAVPKTIFGANLQLDGNVDAGTFLEMIFKAEGLRPDEAIRRCMVCGKESSGIICTECKTKIRAEALAHKHLDEKAKQPGTVAKPRKNPL